MPGIDLSQWTKLPDGTLRLAIATAHQGIPLDREHVGLLLRFVRPDEPDRGIGAREDSLQIAFSPEQARQISRILAVLAGAIEAQNAVASENPDGLRPDQLTTENDG